MEGGFINACFWGRVFQAVVAGGGESPGGILGVGFREVVVGLEGVLLESGHGVDKVDWVDGVDWVSFVDLAYGAFHFHFDESFEFDAVFHGELADEVVDEAVHAEAHGLGFTEAALAHVEDLFCGDFGDAGFVLDGVAVSADGDGGVGVGAAVVVDQQGVTFGVVFAVFEIFWNVNDASVGGAACADGDAFGDDVAGGFVGSVDHFGTGVLVLAFTGQGNGEDFSPRLPAFEDDAGVFHGESGADVAVDPFDFGFFFGPGSFGDEVEDVVGPVLHGDVLDFGTFEGDEFHDGTVKGGCFEFGSGAAFHVGDFGSFVGYDEGAFELAEIFGIDAEVGLEGLLHFNAGWDVDEAASAEDGTVEGGEFVVSGGDDFAEPFAEEFGVFAEAFGGADENDAFFFEVFFHSGVGGFAVELGFYAGEEFAFLLWDAEAFEGVFYVIGYFFPSAARGLAFG